MKIRISVFILFLFICVFKVIAYCPFDTQQMSVTGTVVMGWKCYERAEDLAGYDICIDKRWECVSCIYHNGHSCSSACCNASGCYNHNGEQVGWSVGSGAYIWLPSAMKTGSGLQYDGPGGGGACSACPTGNNLNCSGFNRKCGQPCLGSTSCPIVAGCPSCNGSISIPDCNNTASSADVGAPAVPTVVFLDAETQEKSVEKSTLTATFTLGNNSWITDYCDVTLYKGYNSVETHKVEVAPQCAPKAFGSKSITEEFIVKYDVQSAGVYSVGVKCYNITCG
jgi:hypothetical protein